MLHKPSLPRRSTLHAAATLALITGCLPALAQTLPTPHNVVSLSASATVEVNKDWLTVVFSTTREGADAALVQSQLKQALEAALAEARKVAKPGQVEVQTGNFSLFPRYAQPTPKQPVASVVGWQGSTELVVEGRDLPAIAQLSSRIQTLTIARVSSGLSREARLKVEADITAQAIQRFRERALTVSQQFGFGEYSVREVSVSADMPNASPMAFSKPMALRAGAEDAALPVEVGKATVTVGVSGSVRMR